MEDGGVPHGVVQLVVRDAARVGAAGIGVGVSDVGVSGAGAGVNDVEANGVGVNDAEENGVEETGEESGEENAEWDDGHVEGNVALDVRGHDVHVVAIDFERH